jgi:hypothetical protein
MNASDVTGVGCSDSRFERQPRRRRQWRAETMIMHSDVPGKPIHVAQSLRRIMRVVDGFMTGTSR